MENFVGEVDVKFTIERREFEELSADLLERFKIPVEKAFKESGLTRNDIESVQLLGGGSYIPVLRKCLAKIFQKEPSTSINATESASRGCAMAGAMISKSYVFQRNFDVKDCIQYSVEMGWKSNKEGLDQSLEINKRDLIFKKQDQTPVAKILRFGRLEDFSLHALYKDVKEIHIDNVDELISKFDFSGIDKLKSNSEIKITVSHNRHGIVDIDSAQQVEEKFERVPIDDKKKRW